MHGRTGNRQAGCWPDHQPVFRFSIARALDLVWPTDQFAGRQ
jgi:hypothetical protein